MPPRPSPWQELAHTERYRVGDLLIDIDRRRVERSGVEIHVTELSFDLLTTLLRHAPAVVTRQQLMEEVWQGLVVEPDTVKKRVILLRKSLEDHSHRRPLIRTVRGRGYGIGRKVERFDAAFSRPAKHSKSRLVFIVGATLVTLITTLTLFVQSGDMVSGTQITSTFRTNSKMPLTDQTEVDEASGFAEIDPVAYQAYLEGRTLRRTTDDMSLAIAALERAVKIEPGFADAHAELAMCHLRFFSESENWQPKLSRLSARESARKAMELGPELPAAYAAAAAISIYLDWNWSEADKLLRKGLSIAPNDAHLLSYQSSLATIKGDVEIAVELKKPLVEQAITDSRLHFLLGQNYYYAGRYREAIGAYRQADVLNPKGRFNHLAIGRIRALQGAVEMAMYEMDLEPHSEFQLYGWVIAHTVAGNDAVAENYLNQFIQESATRYPYWIGSLFAYRGEKDEAFTYFDMAFRSRDIGLLSIKVDPLLNGIKNDPRFDKLVSRMGLN